MDVRQYVLTTRSCNFEVIIQRRVIFVPRQPHQALPGEAVTRRLGITEKISLLSFARGKRGQIQ